MRNAISRRKMLSTIVLSVVALGTGRVAALAACSHDHKKIGYRLGAAMVDPTTSNADKSRALAQAQCPSCGISIEPDGLSYGEHMQA